MSDIMMGWMLDVVSCWNECSLVLLENRVWRKCKGDRRTGRVGMSEFASNVGEISDIKTLNSASMRYEYGWEN